MDFAENSHVVVLALGTRGDVEPLLALATAISRKRTHSSVTFITHEAHQNSICEPLKASCVSLILLSSVPALRVRAAEDLVHWDSTDSIGDGNPRGRKLLKNAPCPSRGKSSAEDVACETPHDTERDSEQLYDWGDARFHGPIHFQECAVACAQAIGETFPASENMGQFSGKRSRNRAIIVFNLFALEGWHIAESLGVGSVAASPYMIPYSAPAWLESYFREEHKQLYVALKEQDAHGGCVGWREVEHWMWPLWAPRWASWRQRQLSLPRVPMTARSLTEAPRLPPCTPLLYAFSPLVVPVPGYWPASVRVCGHWFGEEVEPQSWRERGGRGAKALPRQSSGCVVAKENSSTRLDPEVHAFILRAGADSRNVVVVTMGMLPAHGLLPNPQAFLRRVEEAVRVCSPACRALLLLPPGPAALTQEWIRMCGAGPHETTRVRTNKKAPPVAAESSQVLMGTGRTVSGSDKSFSGCWMDSVYATHVHPGGCVMGVVGSIPFAALLPRCQVCVHHGGSGTTAACVRAGVPQVICPFMFDQFYWSERMTWLGVAPPAISSALLAGDAQDATCKAVSVLAAALSQASGDEMSDRARGLAEMLEGERGLQDGVQAVEEAAMQAEECLPCKDASHHQQRHASLHPTQALPDISAPDLDATASHESTQSQSSATPFTRVSTTPVEFPCGLAIDILPGSEVEANHVYREVFVEKVYLRHGVRVPAGGCVVDVGANVGLFTLQVLQMCGSHPPRIVAVEPLPPIYEVLCKNLAAASGQVETVRAGISSQLELSKSQRTYSQGGIQTIQECVSEGTFTYYPSMPGNSTLFPAEKQRMQSKAMRTSFFENSSCYSCPLMTISQLMRLQKIEFINLLKIDVEGAELLALQGIEHHDWARIFQVVCEVHDVNGRLAEVVSLLHDHAFDVSVDECENCPLGSYMVYAHARKYRT